MLPQGLCAEEERVSDATYLREQAERCRRLARLATDPKLRGKLLELGQDFDRKAAELDKKTPENGNNK